MFVFYEVSVLPCPISYLKYITINIANQEGLGISVLIAQTQIVLFCTCHCPFFMFLLALTDTFLFRVETECRFWDI